jgi:hypothetical protein
MAVAVYGDSRCVIDFAACAKHEPRPRVEEQSTAATDTHGRPDIDARMEKAPAASAENCGVSTRTLL